MSSRRWLGTTVAVGFAVATLAVGVAIADDEPYAEGAEVTVVVPRAVVEPAEVGKKKRDEIVEPVDPYEVRVTLGSDGGLVLGGDPDWRSSSLPLVMPGRVTELKTVKRAKATTLTVRGEGREITFLLPMSGGWQGPITEVILPGSATVASPSPELEASLDQMLDAYTQHSFAPPLDALDPRVRRRVAELQFAIGDPTPPTTSTVQGIRCFDARLGEGTVVYNTLTSTAEQRAANTITDRVLPAVKAWTQVFFGQVPFEGLHVVAEIAHKDFTKYPPKTEHDRLELTMSFDAAEDYADDDLSAQELIDAATVTLDGRPVKLDLARQ
jgi:hypothetical protein